MRRRRSGERDDGAVAAIDDTATPIGNPVAPGEGPMRRPPWPFGSFFLGGFETSSLRSREGRWLDLFVATQHDVQAREDYARCRALGIRAIRETARWPVIDRGGAYELGEVGKLARLGRRAGLVQIWDLMHYGYPDDLDPFSDAFVTRFAAYARAAARVLREETAGTLYCVPVNEISFFAWAAGTGHMAPFVGGRVVELKRQLVRASIAATNAVWEVDPDARMVTSDPLVRQHAPPDRPDLAAQVEHFNRDVVFETFDMLAGRREPELGGSRAHLGIVGVNYYTRNQWVITPSGSPERVVTPDDPAYIPLSDLLLGLQRRYGGPLLITETGALGPNRPDWIAYLAREAERALNLGVDLQGICLYPIITSPDWEDTTAFFEAGLFDVALRPDGRQERVLARSVAEALRAAQARLDPDNLPTEPLPPAEPPRPRPPLLLARPLERVRFRTENFSYQTLLAGDSQLVELYCFEPRTVLNLHRHDRSEHALTVIAGQALIEIGDERITLRQSETVLVPAGVYHGISNLGAEPLIVQQVSAPKPWDARFDGPFPSQLEPGPA